MGEVKTIYVVTCGEYSDYRIIAATTDKEKADRIHAMYCGTGYGSDRANDIEEYIDGKIEDSYPHWSVDLDSEGNVTRIDGPYEGRWMYDDGDVHGNKEYGYVVSVYAEDREHASKIASDKFAEYRAAEVMLTLEDYRKEMWEGLSKMFDGVKKEEQ